MTFSSARERLLTLASLRRGATHEEISSLRSYSLATLFKEAELVWENDRLERLVAERVLELVAEATGDRKWADEYLEADSLSGPSLECRLNMFGFVASPHEVVDWAFVMTGRGSHWILKLGELGRQAFLERVEHEVKTNSYFAPSPAWSLASHAAGIDSTRIKRWMTLPRPLPLFALQALGIPSEHSSHKPIAIKDSNELEEILALALKAENSAPFKDAANTIRKFYKKYWSDNP